MKFSDMYPKDRFYAAEFKGKPVTLTFRVEEPVTTELLGKGGPSEKTLPVWHFEETPKKLPAVVTNGVCARALFGDESDDWGGHKITLYPAPDPSGMSDDGLCIRVKGSPELERNLVFTAQIGRTKKTFTLVPTGKGKPPASPPVDDETGEVLDFGDEPSDDDASTAAQDVRGGAETSDGTPDAPEAAPAENGADDIPFTSDSDPEVPGMDAAAFAERTGTPRRTAVEAGLAAAEANAAREAARRISNGDVNKVYAQCSIHGVDEGEELHEWLGDNLGVAHVSDIPAARLDEVLTWVYAHEKTRGGV